MNRRTRGTEPPTLFACAVLITLGWIGHDYPTFDLGAGSPLNNPLYALRWYFFGGAALLAVLAVASWRAGREG